MIANHVYRFYKDKYSSPHQKKNELPIIDSLTISISLLLTVINSFMKYNEILYKH